MRFRPYRIQWNAESLPDQVTLPARLDVSALLQQLEYPCLWVFDEYLSAWFPSLRRKSLDQCSEEELRALNLIVPEGRKDWDILKQEMEQHGLAIIPQLIAPEYARHTVSYYWWKMHLLHVRWPDMEGIRRVSANNLPLMRLLHEAISPLINHLSPEPVKTSYSFAAHYEQRTMLPQHTDRSQCVWNISLLLSGDGDLTQWPLYVKHDRTIHRVALDAGDSVLYSGVRDLHWRDTLPDSMRSVLGVFFHFVPQAFEGSLD